MNSGAGFIPPLGGGGGGTSVTSISIASANGFTGTSSGGTTPILTIATSVSGLLKGSGNALVAATASDITGQLLTGYVSGSGTITSADSILTAIEKLNGNIALLSGAVIYQGLWNANTNTPTLASGVGTKGFYYKVSVAGSTNLDGITQWNVGDSAIFDGTVWDKLDGIPNEVVSVNGLNGVVPLTGTSGQIDISVANVFSIDAGYVGQTSIVTVGTITTGGLGTGAVIGGVTMTLGSDASYDTYYRNSSGVLTRLANGTTGQYLTATSSSAPSWTAISPDSLGAATLHTITDAANFVYSGANGTIQNIVLGAARTFTITNLKIGVKYYFLVNHGSSGATNQLTWGTTVIVGYSGGGQPAQSATNNANDKYEMLYDGTNIWVDYSTTYN